MTKNSESKSLEDNLLRFVSAKSKETAGLTWLGHSDPYFRDRSSVTKLRLQFDNQVWMSDVLEVVHGTSADDYLFYPIHKVQAMPVTLDEPSAFGLTLKIGPAFWQRFDDYLNDCETKQGLVSVYKKQIERLSNKLTETRKQLRVLKKGKK